MLSNLHSKMLKNKVKFIHHMLNFVLIKVRFTQHDNPQTSMQELAGREIFVHKQVNCTLA